MPWSAANLERSLVEEVRPVDLFWFGILALRACVLATPRVTAYVTI